MDIEKAKSFINQLASNGWDKTQKELFHQARDQLTIISILCMNKVDSVDDPMLNKYSENLVSTLIVNKAFRAYCFERAIHALDSQGKLNNLKIHSNKIK